MKIRDYSTNAILALVGARVEPGPGVEKTISLGDGEFAGSAHEVSEWLHERFPALMDREVTGEQHPRMVRLAAMVESGEGLGGHAPSEAVHDLAGALRMAFLAEDAKALHDTIVDSGILEPGGVLG